MPPTFPDIHRPTVQDVVLGQYTFGGGIEVFHSPATSATAHTLTEIHESCHLHLCSTTPFGLFQRHLGFLARAPEMPDELRTVYRTALGYTVEASWSTHEGVATSNELVVAVSLGQADAQEYLGSLPSDYRRALSPFVHLMLSLDLPEWPLVMLSYLYEAIGYVALATSVLDDLRSHARFVSSRPEEYFSQAASRPDARLAILFGRASTESVRTALAQSVRQAVEEHLHCSRPEEVSAAYMGLALRQQKAFNDQLRSSLITVLATHMPFPVVGESACSSQYREHLAAWRDDLHRRGLACDDYSAQGQADDPWPLDHYCCINYVHAKDKDRSTKGGLVYLPFSGPEQLSTWISQTGAPLYVSLKPNFTPNRIPFGGTELEPGGGFVLIHAGAPSDDQSRFVCPLQHGRTDFAGSALAVSFKPEEGNQLLRAFGGIDHVLSMDEVAYRHLGTQRGITTDDVGGACRPPICVIAASSALDHWNEIVRQLLQNGEAFICQQTDRRIRPSQQTACVVGSRNGRVVFVRPTSPVVVLRLKELCDRLVVVESYATLAEWFGEDWTRRLAMCLEHYYQMGY